MQLGIARSQTARAEFEMLLQGTGANTPQRMNGPAEGSPPFSSPSRPPGTPRVYKHAEMRQPNFEKSDKQHSVTRAQTPPRARTPEQQQLATRNLEVQRGHSSGGDLQGASLATTMSESLRDGTSSASEKQPAFSQSRGHPAMKALRAKRELASRQQDGAAIWNRRTAVYHEAKDAERARSPQPDRSRPNHEPGGAPKSSLGAPQQVDEIFVEFDRDGDAHLNYAEWSTLAERLGQGILGKSDFEGLCEDLGADSAVGISNSQFRVIYTDSEFGADAAKDYACLFQTKTRKGPVPEDPVPEDETRARHMLAVSSQKPRDHLALQPSSDGAREWGEHLLDIIRATLLQPDLRRVCENWLEDEGAKIAGARKASSLGVSL